MSRTWSFLCAETFGAKFVDLEDVEFAIKDLLKGRLIGTYRDLARGTVAVLLQINCR